MNLLHAIRFSAGSRIALTGSGGKSSALFGLGREYLELVRSSPKTYPTSSSSELPELAILGGTAHLAVEQAILADHHFIVRDDLPSSDVIAQEQGLVLFTGPQGDEERLKGVPIEVLGKLLPLNLDRKIPLFIEADGSRRKPLKAPASFEPIVPEWVDTVIVVAGLDGLFKPLSPEWVHRNEIFAQLAGISSGDIISVESLAAVLTHLSGGLKGIPDSARRILLLNQARTPELQSFALQISGLLLGPYESVIVGNLPSAEQSAQASHGQEVLAVHEKIAGVILAAGDAKRFGDVKQLLDWQGEPLVRHAARTALAAGLAPVVVVTGSSAARVESAVEDLPVQVVYNPDWESGQASSVKAGIQTLPPTSGGVIFMLSDQPFVDASLLRKLVEMHAATLAAVIAPLVDDRRSNPALFDRATFPDFLALSGDTGGRSLFSRYRPVWLPWLDDRLLLDIDTPEDYQILTSNMEDFD